MKKILSLLLSALLAIFFVTCNSDDISNEDFPDNPETEEDFDVFIERLETEIFNVSDAVNALIDKYGSVDGMLNHFDEVAAVDGVSEIDTTEYTLMLKTNEGFRMFWERIPLSSFKGETVEVNELNKLMAKSASSKNKENEHEHIFKDISGKDKKICIVNQTSSDDIFKEENQLYGKLYLDLKNSGYNVDYIDVNKLTCDWIKYSMEDYNFILFNTHGGFVDNLHWFATGESVTKSSLAKNIKNLSEGKTTISNSEKDNLLSKLSIEKIKEKRNGKSIELSYILVSEQFFEITGDYKDDILFFTSCKTLKGNEAVANVFINKGALAFLGYNETNTVGPKAGHDFLRNMMLGYTVEEAFNKLDSSLKHEEKVDFKPDNSDLIYNYDSKLRLLPTNGKHKDVCIVHPRLKVTTGDADGITPTKATLHGKVEGLDSIGKCKFAILVNKDKNIVNNFDPASKSLSYEQLKNNDGSFKKEFDGLESSTTYYYRAFACYGSHFYSGETKEFTTKEDNEPIRPYLEKLFNSTNGSNWKKNTNWCTDAPVDKWYGVDRDYNNPELYQIYLVDNGLNGSIDMDSCPYISRIVLSKNDLDVLDFTHCENLVQISLSSGFLRSIDVSGCEKLNELYLKDATGLESVRARNCISLPTFTYSEADLVNLDLSGCTSLTYVSVYENKLTTLNLEGCTMLYTLSCHDNALRELDLSTCTSLKSVYCGDNCIRSQVPQYMKDLYNKNGCHFQMDWLYEYSSSSTWLGDVPAEWIKVGDDLYSKENEYGWFFGGEPYSNYNGDPDSWK